MSIDDGERHWADVATSWCCRTGTSTRWVAPPTPTCVSVLELMSPPPWTELPVVRHGAGGERTDVICGYLDVDDPLFDPALAALPPIFVVRPTGAARPWVESSLRYVLEATEGGATDSQVLTRLPAIVLAEVLRLHVASAPAADRGWLAALRDPVLAPALAELHRSPERKWTVAELAAAANVSRSSLDERFRQRAWPLADPVPHRLAAPRRQGAARHHRPQCVRSGPPGGVRRGRGVQPCLQARLRDGAGALAQVRRHALSRRRCGSSVSERCPIRRHLGPR